MKLPTTTDAAGLGTEALVDLVEGAGHGLALLDAAGRLTYVNARGIELLGQPLDDLVGKPVFPSEDGHDHPAILELDAAEEATARSIEYCITPRRSVGSVVWFRDVTASRKRMRELGAFAHTASITAQEQNLSAVLDRLADEVRTATGMSTCTVTLLDELTGVLRYAGKSGLPDDYTVALEACRQNGAPMATLEALHSRAPVVHPGWRQAILDDPRWEPVHEIVCSVPWDTFVAVPLVVRDHVIGVLSGFHPVGALPDAEDVRFLTAMADQAAIAVDNARLFSTLQSRAAQEERHRLARDLHDSVTQALFSLSLQTRGLEMLVATEQKPAELQAQLRAISQLAHGALVEMRELILHRRPAALREEGLVTALRKHAASVQAREQLRINISCTQELLPLDECLEEDLFRLVQEALNNVVKHARASRVALAIGPAPGESGVLLVDVTDDGVGVDETGTSGWHLGQATMRERISRHGGLLTVGPGPGGRGTSVSARVPYIPTEGREREPDD
jgi:PAS domain S-box-containing protein